MHVLSLLSYNTTFIRILRQDLMLSDKCNISIHSSKFNFVTAAKYSLTWSNFQIFTTFASRCPKMAYNSETSAPNIFSKLRSPAVYNPKTNVTTNFRRFASPFDQDNSFHAKSSSWHFITYKDCSQCLGSASQPILICREQHLQSFRWTRPFFSWMFVF